MIGPAEILELRRSVSPENFEKTEQISRKHKRVQSALPSSSNTNARSGVTSPKVVRLKHLDEENEP